MRVFVTGTGRCCTTTFTKACEHFKGFTSAHETNTLATNRFFMYPDNHIESDPRLFWKMPQVFDKYPEAFYVHLIREEAPCVASLSRRESLDLLAQFTDVKHLINRTEVAARYYIFVNEMLRAFLYNKEANYITMWGPPSKEEWKNFTKLLGVASDFEASWREWGVKYNA